MTLFTNRINSGSLVGLSLGSLLIGAVAVPTAASAQSITPMSPPANTILIAPNNTRAVLPISQIRVADRAQYPLNPCPSIYYEYPFNQRVVVPQTCPANRITQQLSSAGLLQQVRDRATQNQVGTPGNMTAPYTDYSSPMTPKRSY